VPKELIHINDSSFYILEVLEASILSDFHTAFFGEGEYEVRVMLLKGEEQKFVWVKRFEKEKDSFDYFVFLNELIKTNPQAFKTLLYFFGSKFIDTLFIEKN
jgi:hypothetical protein